MKKLPNIHPGEVLLEEFLKPMDGTVKLLRRSTKLTYCEADERSAYAAVWSIVVSCQVENA